MRAVGEALPGSQTMHGLRVVNRAPSPHLHGGAAHPGQQAHTSGLYLSGSIAPGPEAAAAQPLSTGQRLSGAAAPPPDTFLPGHQSPPFRSVSCYYERGGGRIYRCGLEYLEDESRYAKWLKPWLDVYPSEQLYVFQVRKFQIVPTY